MIDKWQFDSLKVMLAFEACLGITTPEWTQADVHCGEEYVEYLGVLADRIDREMMELPRDQNGDYGTGISSVSKSTLHGWADRIRKLAEKEGE